MLSHPSPLQAPRTSPLEHRMFLTLSLTQSLTHSPLTAHSALFVLQHCHHCTPSERTRRIFSGYFLSQPHSCLHNSCWQPADIINWHVFKLLSRYSESVSVKEISKEAPFSFDGVESQVENPLMGLRGAVLKESGPSQEHLGGYSKLFGSPGLRTRPRTSKIPPSMYPSDSILLVCLSVMCQTICLYIGYIECKVRRDKERAYQDR